MNILVTGANSQLGQSIKELAKITNTNHNFVFASHSDLDITKRDLVKAYFNNRSFNYCINTAAYTAVDLAETHQEEAYLVNAEAVKYLAEVCNSHQTVLIHISTDFVFDGSKGESYTETDIPNPINVYGASKLQGEANIQSVLDRYFIIRTSWLYSEYGNNFVKTMLGLGAKNNELQVVNDQIGSPTSTKDLAEVTLAIINSKNKQYGLYHYCNQGAISWFDFAKAIFNFAYISIQVTPIPASSYPTPAKRPSFSSLNLEKIKERLNLDVPNWEVSLKGVIQKMTS